MCHCRNCKRRSGGVASYAFAIPKDQVTISGDSHTTFLDKNTESSKSMRRTMCSTCGSPVCIIEESSPDTRCIQYGIFADQELPKPKLEVFRRDACRWISEVGEKILETQ